MTTLINFRQGGEDRVGVVVENGVVDVNRTYRAKLTADGIVDPHAIADAAAPADMLAFLRRGELAREAAGDAVAHVASMDEGAARAALLLLDRDTLDVRVPIANPPKVICVARNYDEHAKEAGKTVSEIPILFVRFANTLIPDGADVVVPKVSHQLDWEGELAVVIGTPGRYITRADAMKHVAGFSVFNDVTVRDYQFRVSQYTGGKNFSSSGPFGPVLVLADSGLDPHNLDIVTTVSGEEMQRGNTRDMVFDIPAIVEHISEFIELEVGDVIAMGTPSGVGFTREPPRFLTPGDAVSVEIPGIGVLTNPVVADPHA